MQKKTIALAVASVMSSCAMASVPIVRNWKGNAVSFIDRDNERRSRIETKRLMRATNSGKGR